jgi:hypothetical protein
LPSLWREKLEKEKVMDQEKVMEKEKGKDK